MAIQEREITFAQGLEGYSGVHDTGIHQGSANTSFGVASEVSVDGSPNQQVLLRFDDLFATNRVPVGATILSATLTLQSTNGGNGGAFHRLLTSWNEASTWNSLSGGISFDGTEAVSSADLTTGSQDIGTTTLDVTSSVQAWANGAANYGWAIDALGNNGWDFATSESGQGPALTVRYAFDDQQPVQNAAPVAANDTASVTANQSININVLGNDSDPNNDSLTLSGISQNPANGTVSILANQNIIYTPAANFVGTDTFQYQISDGRGGTDTATVVVNVNAPPPVPPAGPIERELTFIQGVGGYTGVHDTGISQNNASTSLGNATEVSVDGSPNQQALLRFDDLFAANGVPTGATIVSATLTLQTTNAGAGGSFHRLLTGWSEDSTWNSLSGGISINGIEAVSTADLTTGSQGTGTTTLDVTSSVQAWANGAVNNGWVINALGNNGWDFATSESGQGPALTIRYTVNNQQPIQNTPPVAVNDTANVTANQAVTIDVLGNDSDANNDALMLSGISQNPANGTATILADQSIRYTPVANYIGSDTFQYQISDGRGGTDTATVTVNVNAPPPLPPPTPPPLEGTITFAQGVGGYTGVYDTGLNQNNASTSLGNVTEVSVDGSPAQQVLLRFDDLFSANRVPTGATILSATLTLQTTNGGAGGSFHRLLTGWSEDSTWNSLSGGISVNGIEAVSAADLTTGSQSIGTTTLDVTSSVQSWANGAANHGWVINALGNNGWDFATSESGQGPTLTIRYAANTQPQAENVAPIAANDTANVTANQAVTINVLANDRDPNLDFITLSSITQNPANGTVSITANQNIIYTPVANYIGSDTFHYQISDGRGGTDTASVTINVNEPPPLQFDSTVGYIAIDNASGSTNNFEHTNASKSFYHDGTWWAVLPGQIPGAGDAWGIYQFLEELPVPGQSGGWQIASDALQSSSFHSDIAFDDANDALFVLLYGSNSSNSYLYELSYDNFNQAWETTSTVNLTSSLNSQIYGNNNDLALGVDQFGNPLVLAIDSGSTQGLHIAHAITDNGAQWSSTLLDGSTTSSGGSNGNSKADFVFFDTGNTAQVGIIYSQDSSQDAWRFAWHDSSANSTSYASGWQNELVTDDISIDDHISAVTYAGQTFAAVKDASDALWLLWGSPGDWQAPIQIVSAGQGRSRPVITLDETSERLYVFYQDSTSPGDVLVKVTDLNNPQFNASSSGFEILGGNSSGDTFINPQAPAHAVGVDTDGYFPIIARESGGSEIWWNGVQLSDFDLIA